MPNIGEHFVPYHSSPWFDDNCAEKRHSFYDLLNIYRDNKSDRNRVNMVTARSDYKFTLRKARFEYDKSQTDKLNSARLNNAKEYWKLLKNSTRPCQPNSPMTDFMRYFKAVNSPDSTLFVPDEDVMNFNDTYTLRESYKLCLPN